MILKGNLHSLKYFPMRDPEVVAGRGRSRPGAAALVVNFQNLFSQVIFIKFRNRDIHARAGYILKKWYY